MLHAVHLQAAQAVRPAALRLHAVAADSAAAVAGLHTLRAAVVVTIETAELRQMN